jgi:lysophospholipase L1-like esterase
MKMKRSEEQAMDKLQKRAILVCIVCTLAVVITACVTSFLVLMRVYGGQEQQPDLSASAVTSTGDATASAVSAVDDISDYYQIDTAQSAVLGETADAGESYLEETLFLGDSNTVRFYQNGLLSLQQYCAKEGLSVLAARTEKFVTFKKDNDVYTLADAVAKLKPRRVVITLGTNDSALSTSDFISNYRAFLEQLQGKYPYADVIVNTVPPIPAAHANYPDMTQEKIDDFNMALADLCEEMGVKFLNSAEALKDASGYGNAAYYNSNDIHLTSSGLKVMLNYVRTHAYDSADRRPDTSNIPQRAQDFSNTPSAAVTATPTDTPDSSSNSTSESAAVVDYQAYYQVDRGTGGTLTCGKDTGKLSLNYEITNTSTEITVTAVPASGYVFLKWSDGVTTMTRTDTNFKQNVNVTAIFGTAAVSISGASTATPGQLYTVRATLTGQYATAANLHWYVNGVEVTEAAGQTRVSFSVEQEYEQQTYVITAAIVYNESRSVSNSISLIVDAAPSSSSSSASSDPSERPDDSSEAEEAFGAGGSASSVSKQPAASETAEKTTDSEAQKVASSASASDAEQKSTRAA